MLEKGAIEPIQSRVLQYVFHVPKKTRYLHLVINLKPQNQYF